MIGLTVRTASNKFGYKKSLLGNQVQGSVHGGLLRESTLQL